MKLNKGETAPDFTLPASNGGKITLGSYKGKKSVVLSFLRYLGCPFCQQRVDELNARKKELNEAGAEVLVVLESTEQRVASYAKKKGISVLLLSDKPKDVFRTYGTEKMGLGGFLKPKLLADTVKVTLKGYMHGMPGGDELQLPADFVIGRDGKIAHAHYGTSPNDSLPADELLKLLKEK